MARRMFSDDITSSDVFLDMPSSSQLLYFQLGMKADDDGFISNPKMIVRMMGANEDDLKILIAKKFLLAFENGICVVKGWRINNQIRKDRYTETKYTREKEMLFIRENGTYSFSPENALPVPKGHFSMQDIFSGNQPATIGQPSIGKVSIGKVSKVKVKKKPSKHKYGEYKNVLLSDDEKQKLKEKFGVSKAKKLVKEMDEAIEMKGYSYKSHYLAILKWEREDKGDARFGSSRPLPPQIADELKVSRTRAQAEAEAKEAEENANQNKRSRELRDGIKNITKKMSK